MIVKNIKLIISCIIGMTSLILGCCVHAAPLVNYPYTITQPDGTEIECYLNGDEYFGYLTDGNGAIIIQNPDTGEYTYARFDEDELVHSANIVGETIAYMNDDGGGIPSVYFEDLPESYIQNIIENKKNARRETVGAELFSLSENNLSTMGFAGKTLNNIVIFVEFSDTVFSSSHKSYSYYDGLFNTNSKSMKNFYNEVSYGQTAVNSVFATDSANSVIATYKSSNSRSYYESDYNLLWELMNEAVAWAISNNYIPEDISYDADGDGVVDCVTFIFAGDVQDTGEHIFWPQAWNSLHSWYLSETIHGKRIGKYFLVPEMLLYNSNTGYLYQKNEAILCHESFHAIFEGWDLYDDSLGKSWSSSYGVYKNAIPMRKWDIMSSSPGAHMSSYMKYRYGNWITIPEIKSSGSYTLKPLNTTDNAVPGGTLNDTVAYILRSPIPVSGADDVSQYFIIEYRKYNGNFETTGNLQGSGLVIYRVNSNFDDWGNNYNTVDGNNSKYEIEEVYPKSSSLSLKYSNNVSSGITISHVTVNSTGTITFSVTMPETKNLIYFKDSRLAEAVRLAVGKSASEVTAADIAALTTLNISIGSKELPLDLSGMEHMTGLTSFTASNCKIDDITPLQNLDNITYLDLTYNNIKDISVLRDMSGLTTLKLRGNLIDDYSPTQNYYDDITTKDFSLTNSGDLIFRIPDMTSTGEIDTVYVSKSQYLPNKVYNTVELFSADGVLQRKNKTLMNISASGTQMSFSMPSGYQCGTDGSYVVLSAYEREDEKQLLTRITIKPTFFGLQDFN